MGNGLTELIRFCAIFMHIFEFLFGLYKYIFGSIWPISSYNTEPENINNEPRDETTLKYDKLSKKCQGQGG